MDDLIRLAATAVYLFIAIGVLWAVVAGFQNLSDGGDRKWPGDPGPRGK